MLIRERLVLDGVRRTNDGYLTATARIARTGVQVYAGAELGVPDKAEVKVYRPDNEVFLRESLHSFAHRPITNDHPSEQVTADNWKEYAVGLTGEDVLRDGEFIRVPLVLMDGAAIQAVDSGKRELSAGYTSEIKFEAGMTPGGEAYDAIMTNIRANHVAICDVARGGPELKIGDRNKSVPDAPSKQEDNMSDKLKAVLVDGVTVEMSDVSAAIVQRALTGMQKKIDELSEKLEKEEEDTKAAKSAKDAADAEHKKAIETKDGEIAGLKKQLEDAKIGPEKLDAMVKDRFVVIQKAKAVLGDSYTTDGKTDAEIRKAVVAKKLGDDAAKAMTDAAIEGAFKALTADVKGPTGDPLATAFSSPAHNAMDAREKAYGDYTKSLTDAWRPNSAAKAS